MKRHLNPWRLFQAGGLALAVSACGSNGLPKPEAVVRDVSLLTFKGPNACTELEKHIEDTAVLQMRSQMEQMRDGIGWWGWLGRTDDGPMAEASTQGGDASKNGPSAYTTTNTQVAGVDEADFIKNDGTRIFALSGKTLYATKSWPADQLAIQGKLTIEGYPREMFLDDANRIVVFSNLYRKRIMAADVGSCGGPHGCDYSYANTVKVTVVDASDLANLKVSSSYEIPGTYVSSRRIGHAVRVVLTDGFNFPRAVQLWPNTTEDIWSKGREDARRRAFNEQIAKNEAVIRAQTIREWLPEGIVRAENGPEVPLAFDCDRFSKVNAPAKLGMVTVATLNLDNPATVDRNTIIAEPGEVYASKTNLYVSTRHWFWWPVPGQRDTTYLHKFDISSPDTAQYVASGVVDGHIVDQFSMDEDSKGYFRIATTIGSRVVDLENRNNTWGRIEWNNRVSVMAEREGRLSVIGQSEDVAPGERITSARFFDDTAYVVTFRNVDPLFSFDLSDPTAPRKIGELKIPGFSTYIHPLDKDHLLTIGYYQDENGGWSSRRLQLSIFDVTDRANVKQTFTQQVGTSHSGSEAVWNHKAFNYFPEKKLLAIPFSDWDSAFSGNDYWSRFMSELRVYSVDALTGFSPRGAISLSDMFQVYGGYNWTYYYTPTVRRSVMADDYVYAISDAGIRAAHISSLSSPLATVRFDKVVWDR